MNNKSDKKRYEDPEIDVVRLGGEDVIRTSEVPDHPDDNLTDASGLF